MCIRDRAKPGSITPHTKFKAEAYVLTKEEGGRHTPFFTGYRPQFYFRTTDVTGDVKLPAGVEMVMPGDLSLIHISFLRSSFSGYFGCGGRHHRGCGDEFLLPDAVEGHKLQHAAA